MPGNSKGNEPDKILNGQYARARREPLELVRNLRALGHDKDLDIPQTNFSGSQGLRIRRRALMYSVHRSASVCLRRFLRP
ncbi:hypothetical protein LXA43DRAFT_449360 [Ganoderma leucocontextum]|nr:hypothetical protein LXA43DRAFT_449360 [Ganoderma leucocontextum]